MRMRALWRSGGRCLSTLWSVFGSRPKTTKFKPVGAVSGSFPGGAPDPNSADYHIWGVQRHPMTEVPTAVAPRRALTSRSASTRRGL